MAFLTVVELICTSLAAAGAIVLISGTFASKNAYDEKWCPSKCALFSKFDVKTTSYPDFCGNKHVCDGTLFAGFASLGLGLLFILQTIGILCHEWDGRKSRFRCFTFPKVLAAVVCVLGLFGIAVMVSAGVGTYCNHLESSLKKVFHATSLGCRDDSEIHQLFLIGDLKWPTNGFKTVEVMLGGVWVSFLLWVVVLGLNIYAYRHRTEESASFGFQEMPDTASSPSTH